MQVKKEIFKAGMEDGFITRYISKENPNISWGIPTEEDCIPVEIPYIIECIDGEKNKVFVNEGDYIIYENGNKRIYSKEEYAKIYNLIINDIENTTFICSKCKENIPSDVIFIKDIINSTNFDVIKSGNKTSFKINNEIFYFVNNKMYCKECFRYLIVENITNDFILKYGEKFEWDSEIEIKYINFTKAIFNKFKID